MKTAILLTLILGLISCGESEQEKLARETREGNAKWEEERKKLKALSEQELSPGIGFEGSRPFMEGAPNTQGDGLTLDKL